MALKTHSGQFCFSFVMQQIPGSTDSFEEKNNQNKKKCPDMHEQRYNITKTKLKKVTFHGQSPLKLH